MWYKPSSEKKPSAGFQGLSFVVSGQAERGGRRDETESHEEEMPNDRPEEVVGHVAVEHIRKGRVEVPCLKKWEEAELDLEPWAPPRQHHVREKLAPGEGPPLHLPEEKHKRHTKLRSLHLEGLRRQRKGEL